MKKILFLHLFIILYSTVYCVNIDSLISELPNKTDTAKVDLLNKIVDEIMFSNPKEAIIYANRAIIVADSIGDKQRIVLSNNNIGMIYNERGDYINARKYFKISLNNSILLKDSINIAKTYGNIGNSYMYQTENKKALESYLKALNIFELLNYDNGKALVYGTLGNLYLEIKDYKNALESYGKASKLFMKLGNKAGLATVYMNTGVIYKNSEKEYKKAIENFSKALEIYKEFDYKRGVAQCYANIGEIYIAKEEYKLAIKELESAIKIFNDNKIYDEETLSLINLGDIYTKLNNKQSALIYYKKAYKIAKQINSLKYIEHSGTKLYETYKSNKNYAEALKYHEILLITHDSLYDIEKENKFQELLSKFESEKKEKEIETLKETEQLNGIIIEKNKQKLKLQRIVIIFSIVGIVFGLIFIIIILKQNRDKRRANNRLVEKNEEINQQNEEIKAQRDEIGAQRDKVISQKELIEQIHEEVSESIEYATRIQKSILPEEKLLTKFLSNHFVLFKPKDRVSGDFYWWTHIEKQTVITAADCTGHGVPGAFMSMLGVSFLREIVQKEYITHPAVILKKLRKEVIKSLKQKDEIGGQKDGMDMAIVSIDHETNVVQFSGANNPLYIIKSGKLDIESDSIKLYELDEPSNFKLYEVKPDKMPISVYYKMENFTNHEFQLHKGDKLYMFSDGYADQFGGQKGRKFKYKPFKDLLLKTAKLPMDKQKEILTETFNQWKGNHEQIDDIVVVGIEI